MKITDEVLWTFDGWSKTVREITNIITTDGGRVLYILDDTFTASAEELTLVANDYGYSTI